MLKTKLLRVSVTRVFRAGKVFKIDLSAEKPFRRGKLELPTHATVSLINHDEYNL